MKFDDWVNEDVSKSEDCNLCKETSLKVGDTTEYGSKIIFREDGWMATLSPKTGSDPEEDFSIQLIPLDHLTHFCQLSSHPKLAESYGFAFSKLSYAVSKIMAEENPNFDISTATRKESTSVATYGKCTNWKEKKEHLHIKIFPFRGAIGQPYTVDSTWGRMEVFNDESREYIKMKPVRKVMIDKKRFEELSEKLISLLK